MTHDENQQRCLAQRKYFVYKGLFYKGYKRLCANRVQRDTFVKLSQKWLNRNHERILLKTVQKWVLKYQQSCITAFLLITLMQCPEDDNHCHGHACRATTGKLLHIALWMCLLETEYTIWRWNITFYQWQMWY